MKYLIANWKAQMTLPEIVDWISIFNTCVKDDKALITAFEDTKISVSICPPYPFILYVKDHLFKVPNLSVGAQNISTVTQGKFTGEVTAAALKDMCEYAIIGHSERRKNFNESEENISLKISLCNQSNLRSILCVRNEVDVLYENASLIAYEPPNSIGTGNNASVDSVLKVKNQLNLSSDQVFIYGGSVDGENMKDYLKTGKIDGFLVGTASLNPRMFYNMCVRTITSQ